MYIFCVEGVFVLGCVFLEWFLASCGWFLAFGGHVLGLRIENLCCVSLIQHSRLGGVACPLIGAEQDDGGMAAEVVCSLSVAAGASEVVFPLVDSGVHDSEFHRRIGPTLPVACPWVPGIGRQDGWTSPAVFMTRSTICGSVQRP